MIKIMLRLDGVVADVLQEYVESFNLFSFYPTGFTVSTLLNKRKISPTVRNLISSIATQPEPYHNMKIFPQMQSVIQRMKAMGWEVIAFTSTVQKDEKELWVKRLKDELGIELIITNEYPNDEEYVVIDMELNKRGENTVCFYNMEYDWICKNLYSIWSWNDLWEDKIKRIKGFV